MNLMLLKIAIILTIVCCITFFTEYHWFLRINGLKCTSISEEWTPSELGRLVQKRIAYIQNPKDCVTVKKLVCDVDFDFGYGSIVHHVATCLIAAYATNRTLILDSKGWRYAKKGWDTLFLPLSKTCTTTFGMKGVDFEDMAKDKKSATQLCKKSNVELLPDLDKISKHDVIKMPHFTEVSGFWFFPLVLPDDLADKIIRFHGYPPVWWVGQFVSYLTRPNNETQQYLDGKEKKLDFKNPIVGIHIRRSDKIQQEAKLYSLEEYMFYVEKWFDNLDSNNAPVQRVVYLASDDPTVRVEASKKYPNYRFVTNMNESGQKTEGYSTASLRSIVTDVYFLSKCDYVVCTHSSNICRLVYEQMQTLHDDASSLVKSLDYTYFYHLYRAFRATSNHTATEDEIDIQEGDCIFDLRHFQFINGDGRILGLNARTKKHGLFPFNITVPMDLKRVPLPTYPEVSIMP